MKTAQKTFWVMGVLLSITLTIGMALVSCASGGTAAGLSGVTTWYVRENGSNANSGMSEDAPFKTLAHAIARAAGTRVKTITVLGTLTTPAVIENITSADEILITGKPGETAELKMGNGRAISLQGTIKIRLEGIAITDCAGMTVLDGAAVTIGNGAKISGCDGAFGGGVRVEGNGSMLIMEGDAEISGNNSYYGGGVFLDEGASLVMKDNAVIKENSTATRIDDGNFQGGAGGGVFMQGSSLLMQDTASIIGNNASWEDREGKSDGSGSGGGIQALRNCHITMQGNAFIADNAAGWRGGGIALVGSALLMKGQSSIRGNKATGIETTFFGQGREQVRVNTPHRGGAGGGVFAQSISANATLSVLTMEDGASIQNNSADEAGGGIWLQTAGVTFTQNSGVVSGNTSGRDPDISRE